MGILTNFLSDNQFKTEELSTFKEKLFFEGTRRRVKIVDDRIDLEIYGSGEQPVKLHLIVVPAEKEDYVPLLE